jgi:hypothetical protein
MDYDSERIYHYATTENLSRYYISIPQKQDFWKHYTEDDPAPIVDEEKNLSNDEVVE